MQLFLDASLQKFHWNRLDYDCRIGIDEIVELLSGCRFKVSQELNEDQFYLVTQQKRQFDASYCVHID